MYGNKSSFGLRRVASAAGSSSDLLKAARDLVRALGYEPVSDLDAARVLHEHACKVRSYRAGGNEKALDLLADTLPEPEPEPEPEVSPTSTEPVAGELPLVASDVAGFLEAQGLSVRVGFGGGGPGRIR